MYLSDTTEDTLCRCCTKHVPNNLKTMLVTINSEVVYLCPTSFYNLESLRALYVHYLTEPPGSVRKHYSDYIQMLAKQLQA